MKLQYDPKIIRFGGCKTETKYPFPVKIQIKIRNKVKN
jgi:hypothetical protein